MPNEFGKSIDKTYLSVDMAEDRGFIHRDYIAHCLRWSHIIKHLQEGGRYKTARILDIGCGREFPLIKTLYSSRLIVESYCGVDYGPINPRPEPLLNKIPCQFFSHTNILDTQQSEGDKPFTTIVMLEALEHMEKSMGSKVLQHIQSFMVPETTFFLSTPCFDGTHKAANHVYEWGYEELFITLTELGFRIEGVWGTFASIKDYKGTLEFHDLGLAKVFDRLRAYYDVNLLSVIFAPLFPGYSRNALWQLSLLPQWYMAGDLNQNHGCGY